MGTSSPIVKTYANVAGFSGNELLCSRGHSVAMANMTASWLGLSKVSTCPSLCYSTASLKRLSGD